MNERKEYIEKSVKYYDERFGSSLSVSEKLNSEELNRLREIKSRVAQLTQDKERIYQLLDFGCGRGWIANELQSFGKVSGIDLSPKTIELAKSKYPSVEFLCGDLGDPTFSENLTSKFDLIVSSEVIEHLDMQDQFVSNIKKALKKYGRVVLTTPNGDFYDKYFNRSRKHWGQPIENWLTPKELSALFERNDFEIEKHYIFNSDWIFCIHVPGVPKLLNNRLTRKAFKNMSLQRIMSSTFRYSNYGLYQMIVAKSK